MFVKKLFTYLLRTYLEKFNVKFSTYYFHMKTKILADFQICISVPLISDAKSCPKQYSVHRKFCPHEIELNSRILCSANKNSEI